MSQMNAEDYTNFIDSAEMIIEYYKNQVTTGLEKYFLEIEAWLNKDVNPMNNKPLVIEAEEGVGKKTLVVKWMDYHQANNRKLHPDVIIPNFAGTGGSNSNYFYAIYNILIKLRESFDIDQKVELVEEKLRKFFNYWLDVCSRKIHEQVVNDSAVILLFESINLYVDPDTGDEAHCSMWLPRTFPANVRAIVTADPNSDAMAYFKSIGCDIIKISSEPLVIQKQIEHHLSRPLFITDEHYKQRIIEILNNKPAEAKKYSLFVKIYLSCLLPYPSDTLVKESDIDQEDFNKMYENFDFNKLEAVENIVELNAFILEFYSEAIMSPEKFQMLMSLFTLTQKGLTAAEMFAVADITTQEWNKAIAVFKTFLMKYSDLWKISNEVFKKAITAFFLTNTEYRFKLHNCIADALEKVPNSVRKLEEQTYHLYCGEAYFRLKEAVSNIENFLLLFNPNNKYELCRYWQRLEEKGFDPSLEYNKAVENFDMHYKPNPQDTFRIILQISRFLKEFSDFETLYTPDFRHPPIKGGDELRDIGLRKEISKMAMLQNEQMPPVQTARTMKDSPRMDKMSSTPRTQRFEPLKKGEEPAPKKNLTLLGVPPGFEAEDDSPNKLQPSEKEVELDKEKRDNDSGSDLGELKPTKPRYLNAPKRGPFDKFFETLNIEIAENREIIRKMYMAIGGLITEDDLFPERAQKRHNFMLEDERNNKINEIETESAEQEDSLLAKRGLEGQRELLNKALERYQKQLKLMKEVPTTTVLNQDNDTLPDERKPLYYYYKRWIWMMFPWVCISVNLSFSDIMEACFKSATEYMSVKDEYEYTQQALKIAVEAKLKKRMMYARNDGSIQTILFNQSRINPKIGDSNLEDSQYRSPKQKILDSVRMADSVSLSQSMVKDEFTLSLDKTRLSNPNMLLDNLSPIGVDNRHAQTTKVQKDSHFFVTNEFLNLNYLNSHRSPQPLTGTYAQSNFMDKSNKKSFLYKGDTSINSVSIMDRSRGYKEKNTQNMIDRGIDEVLKDRSMHSKMDPDSRKNLSTLMPAKTHSTPNLQNKKRAQMAVSVDTSASAILPKLKSSLHMHSARGLVTVEQKIESLIREFNDTAYKNKLLAKKLKDLKIKKMNFEAGTSDNPVETAKKKRDELKGKVEKANKMLDVSKQEQKRLNTIISVCLKNKIQNENWTKSLNHLLQNLKTLIKCESDMSEQNGLEITTIQKSSGVLFQMIKDKIANHIGFLQHIHQELANKDQVAKRLTHIDEVMETTAMDINERLAGTYGSQKQNNDDKKHAAMLEKNNKKILELLEVLERDYEKIRIIVEEENYEDSEKFQNFLSAIERRNDLEKTLLERNLTLGRINEQIREKEIYLETLKKASANTEKVKEQYDITDETIEISLRRKLQDQDKQNEATIRSNARKQQSILDAKVSLNTICRKLGIEFKLDSKLVSSVPTSEIRVKVEEKLQYIRDNKNEDEYEKLWCGQYDFDQLYKQSLKVDPVLIAEDSYNNNNTLNSLGSHENL